MKLVYGVGINDRRYPTLVDGKIAMEYALWKRMLERCYSPALHKKRPTYTGCSVSEPFKHFSYFREWATHQVGFNYFDEGVVWPLDKDLLVKGNKVYSEYTCVFVPRKINMLLIKRDAARGVHPIGVSWDKIGGCYRASCRVDGVLHYISSSPTAESAFQAYKAFKEESIKKTALEYKNLLDPRAFKALLQYTVEIDD